MNGINVGLYIGNFYDTKNTILTAFCLIAAVEAVNDLVTSSVWRVAVRLIPCVLPARDLP